MKFNFFAYIYRMRYIERWGLMKNLSSENLSEHSSDCAILAHALAVIANEEFGENIDGNLCATVALFHDCSEIITGDLPTPIKYFSSDILSAYKSIEGMASNKLLEMIPQSLQPSYKPLLLNENKDVEDVVKWADKFCAYIKCIEELKSGNEEFRSAYISIGNQIKASDVNYVSYFFEK